MRNSLTAFVAWLAITLISIQAWGTPPGMKTLEVGATAPDFLLQGVDGASYSLKNFADSRLLLVVFTCNHCPTAQAYEDRIKQLHADYKDRDVAVVAISPNDDKAVRLDELGYSDLNDSLPEMKLRAEHRGFLFPYLYDGDTQKTSFAFGVMATPQVFLFDEQRTLRYVGRIDDSDVREVTRHDAREAIDELLAGRPVTVEKTRTFGCSSKWSDKRQEAEAAIAKWNQEPVTISALDEVALLKLVKNETDDLLVINLWATWCGPCIAELPEFVALDRMYRHRNVRVITISVDEPGQTADALKVLQRHHVSAKNYQVAIEDRDHFAELLDKKWEGPVPYTLLIAPGGQVISRHASSIDALAVRREIIDVIGRTYASRKPKP